LQIDEAVDKHCRRKARNTSIDKTAYPWIRMLAQVMTRLDIGISRVQS
jgi:hypothetical protein